MRPDTHKAKESRKYQARKKNTGDTSAAEVAEARRRAARARDKGAGIAAIRRRNGEFIESEEDIEERKLRQAKFSKRKIMSNVSRYEEETEQEALERDAELGIDRETTNLVDMLENTEEGTSTFFKFKDELSNNQTSTNMLELDFNTFEAALESYETVLLLDLDKDQALISNALNEHPIVLDKPIVPSFSKNAKGYVLFKSQPAKPNVISEADGIYVRNDRPTVSQHKPKHEEQKQQQQKHDENDELDQLLALDQKPTALPKPGSIKKPTIPVKNVVDDDEAWLDDILG